MTQWQLLLLICRADKNLKKETFIILLYVVKIGFVFKISSMV